MRLKWLLPLSLILITPTVFATTCPSIADIKHSTLHGWQVYDSDDNKPLGDKRLADFKKSIKHFVLAEWKQNTAQLGTMRCYYTDNDGSELEAYIAKNHFSPSKNKNEWYQVSGSLNCAASMGQCTFYDQKGENKILAKN